MQTLERDEVKAPVQAPIKREDYQELVRNLKRIEGRLRLQEAVRLLPFGILGGGLVGLLVALYSRITPSFTLEQVAMIAISAFLIGVLGVLLYAFFRPRPLLQTARKVDLALDLKERLSTALEGHSQPEKLGYARLGTRQFSDAVRSVDGLKYSKSLPLKVSVRQGLASIAIIPLLALALLMPNPFSDQVKQNEAVKAQIEEQAKKIEELKQSLIKQNPEAAKNDPKLQELLKELEQVKKDLLEKSNNKDEALAALEKARQELEKLGDSNKSTAEKAALESLARTLNSSDVTKPAGEALQQSSADRFDKAASELEKLANKDTIEQLKKDPAKTQELADKLSKEAENFKNANGEMSKKLEELSSALNPNNLSQDSKAAEQGFKDVAQQLRETGKNQQINEQLQQAQAQLQNSEQSINREVQKGQQSQNSKNRQAEANQDDGESGDPTEMGENGQPAQQGQDGQQSQQGQPQQGQQGQQGQDGQQGQQGQQGQDGQNQQGQDGQGQGKQPGQDQGAQGEGQQPGDGQGQQQGQGDQGEDQGDNQTKGSKAGKGNSDRVYADPTKRRDQGTQVNVQGKNGQGPTNNQTVNGGDPSGEANVPYTEVLDAYRQSAAQQLDKNYVPITLKDMVKQYFDDLNKDK